MKQHRLHRISYVAKRIIVVGALACLLVSSKEIGQAEAQIFILNDEEYLNSNRGAFSPGMVPVLPQGTNTDFTYAPLGGGWLLLGGMGCAYLLCKRRKKDE
jgi:hypothetical protein